MEYAIAFIAPYPKLAELFAEVSRELNKKIHIEIGDLEEGAHKAAQLEEEGIDVVISRGGTAIAIKSIVTNLPVVEIQISGFDLIRALHQARRETDRIIVAGFYPYTFGIEIETLEEILGIKLKVLMLKEEWINCTGYIEEKLREAQRSSYFWLVGDHISVKLAEGLGINTVLIKSGKEALVQAIFEAERVAEVRKREMEKTERLKSIIDFAQTGIISVNCDGHIDTFNPAAEDILEKKAYRVIGKHIELVLPGTGLLEAITKDSPETEKVWTVGNKKVAANIIPVKVNDEVVSVISTFHRVSQIQKMEQKIREELYLKGYTAENTFNDIIGESKIIAQTKEEAWKYAQIDSSLLLYGETGSGKDLFAQAIHNASPRRHKFFVAFNCAALPPNLLESELFGYIEGAFTGATKKGKMGLFEQAHEGTIFLDEIGEIPIETQAKLLRVLEERKVRRLGDDKLTPIDVRVIASTNKDLKELVKAKKFREDLYYRLDVLSLRLPSLRERKEDIRILIEYFIQKNNSKLKKMIKGISYSGLKIMENYRWPGNVRQLENVVEKLMVRTQEGLIKTSLVKDTMRSQPEFDADVVNACSSSSIASFDEVNIRLNGKLEDIERYIIKKVVEEEHNNKMAAARRLGISRTTLWRKLKA